VGGIRASARRRALYLSIPLALALCAAALSSAVSTLPSLASELGHYSYLPFASRPVPTPTLTPTATPLPSLSDVRVEESCCNFRGGSRQDPNGEYVCFRNYDFQPVDMTDWRVQDAVQHTYVFPPFVLNPGAIVRLHSGAGSNTATELHWARGLVWNNDHDTVYLYDALGRLVDSYVY